MPLLRLFLLWLSRRHRVGDWLQRAPFGDRLVSRFVAGPDRDSAVDAARSLIDQGYRVTLAYLGEDVESESEAAASVEEYQQLLGAIADAGIASQTKLAVKASLLGMRLSEEIATANLRRIAAAAAEAGVGLELDMERSDSVDATLALYRAGLETHPDLGVALQSYLRRSPDDLAELIQERRAHVRLVKGAYSEPEAIAHNSTKDIVSAYHTLLRMLMEPEAIEQGSSVGVATHDERLIASARTRAFRKHVPADRWEVQMLYGIRPKLQRRLLGEGYAVRISVPYGEHWYPYVVRRLAERPANLWFALQQIVRR